MWWEEEEERERGAERGKGEGGGWWKKKKRVGGKSFDQVWHSTPLASVAFSRFRGGRVNRSFVPYASPDPLYIAMQPTNYYYEHNAHVQYSFNVVVAEARAFPFHLAIKETP